MRFLALEEHGTSAIRRHAMDFARVAGGDKKIAFSIERQRPDIFGLGIVEDFELAVRRDLVDFAIGGSAYEDAVLAIDGDGMNLDGRKLREGLFLSAG